MCDRAESPLRMIILLSDMPAYGCVQTPLFVSYIVRNRTLQVQEVEVTVEPSEAFMYSGHKQVKFILISTCKMWCMCRKIKLSVSISDSVSSAAQW